MSVNLDTAKMQEMIADTTGRDRWLRGVGQAMLGDIVASFGTGPGGNKYPRGNKVHVASRPGYPPNIDTGALRASMKLRKLKLLSYQIEDGVEYGIKMEFGTEKVARRPFVRPVFHNWTAKINDAAKDGLVV